MPKGNPYDLMGQRFGRYEVIGLERDEEGRRRWRCRCECGVERLIKTQTLRVGEATSCGCKKVKHGCTTRAARAKKDDPDWRLYLIWRSMNDRCANPKNRAYHNYGGRGIAVCDRWRGSFEAFKADMGPRPTPEHTLDRKDNDGPYSPENCRWATGAEQGRNRRCNRVIEHGGTSATLTEWAERTGVSAGTISARLRAGWDVGRALTAPLDTSKRRRSAQA